MSDNKINSGSEMLKIYSTFENPLVKQHVGDSLLEISGYIDVEWESDLLALIRTSDYPDLVIVDNITLAKQLKSMLDRQVFMIAPGANKEEQLSAWESGITYLPVREYPRQVIYQKVLTSAALQSNIDIKLSEASEANVDLQMQLENFRKYYQPRLLIVEDDEEVVNRISTIFEQLEGFSDVIIDHAVDLVSAREFLSKSEPTMIMLDNHLKGGEKGCVLFDEIKDKFRVVYLTSDYVPVDAVEEMQSGALDYLEKPLEFAFGRNYFSTYFPLLKKTSYLNYVLN